MVRDNPGVFVTQRVFRALMDALARPGRRYRTPAFPDARLANPYFEGIVRTLLDQSCGFAVASCASGEGAELAACVSLVTSAVRVEPERARFALITSDVPRAEQTALIEGLTGGTALSPERGATAIVECQRLSAGTDDFFWQVRGPGVRTCHHFASSEDAWFAGRLLRRDEFPCGIDLILVDGQGNLVGLPRTARVDVSASDAWGVSDAWDVPDAWDAATNAAATPATLDAPAAHGEG